MSDIDPRLIEALEDRYAIQSEIGEGGMATVYLADDIKHDRKVALKVLKPELAAVIGGERFVTEIKTTAALQHPHILPLFDSGEADSFLYYVMPFVDGESLRDRLDRERQLDVREAVHIATAVASALQYAHDNDIIHRDIKPENILIHAGEPVVADFGIALAISAAGGGRLTETGLSLGTPHYMSPEQATADRDLSARSDVYALACVTYEMLAGAPPHTGPTAQSILMRILTEDPRPVTELRRSVPPHIGAALDKALEKLPADRFRSADEFKKALSDESFTYERKTGPQTAAVAAPGPASAPDRWGSDFRTRVLIGTNLLFLLGLGWALTRGGPELAPESLPVHRFVIDEGLEAGISSGMAIGPGGDVVFTYSDTSGSGLRLRRAGSLASEHVPGSEGATRPDFSPDGEWIVFGTESDGLKKVQVGGGPVITVVRSTQPWGDAFTPHWGDNGMIAFMGGDGAYLVPDVGGEPERVLEGTPPQLLNPRILPGGRGLLHTRGGLANPRVLLLDLASGDTTTLIEAAGHAFWSPSGHLLHGHESGAIFAAPFDLDDMAVTGPSVPVLEGVQTIGAGMYVYFDLTEAGSIAYVGGSVGALGSEFTFAWRDHAGETTRIPLDPVDHEDAAISPDGNQIAYAREDPDEIRIYDVNLGTNAPLTFEGANHHNPIWSPDGTQIAFSAEREGSQGIDVYIKAIDGRTPAENVASTEWQDYAGDWLEDGSLILYTVGNADRQSDIYRVQVDGDTEPEPLLQADWSELYPKISPDGRWIAYRANPDDVTQLYVRTYPELGGQWIVSDPADGTVLGTYPLWTPDGQALIYWQDGRIVRANLSTDPTFQVLSREDLSEGYVGQPEDLHPDGDRILVLAQGSLGSAQGQGVTPVLVVVSNWFTELRGRLGEGDD
jgi:serine/threonine-protein kinase